jgi:probable phosphoglycerate mutase
VRSDTPSSLWVFLRHGQCEGNVARLLAAAADSPLTARGRLQARAAAGALRGIPLVSILTSPMLRARQTASIVAAEGFPYLTPEVVSELGERSFGALGEWTVDAVKSSPWGRCRTAWDQAVPGGETLAEVASRSVRALIEHAAQGPTLVVAHAGVIRSLVGLLDGVSPDRIGEIRVPHCEPWSRQVRPSRWAELLGV